MKERPILFSGEMVRAILDGRKTQTRRVVIPARSANGQHCGLYLELKRVEGGQVSSEQKEFINGVIAEGYKGVVAQGHRAAIAEIKQYLGIDRGTPV